VIRVLVADDSATFRAILRTVLATAPDLEVVGEACDGEEAVARTVALRPDVVTMDVHMPRLGGLEAIRRIMVRAPTPVLVVSAEVSADEQRLGFEALRAGAVDVVPKPRRSGAGSFERQAEAIRAAVRAVAGTDLSALRGRVRRARRAVVPSSRAEVVGIAASTGGPAALARILAALPAGYGIPILVVQHIAPGFEEGLVRWLQGETRLRVGLADDGSPVEPGAVLVARGGRHLATAGGRVRLDDGPPVRGFRPSGSVLFRALAAEHGGAAAGLVLTGMGDDGAAGLLAVREAGGYTAAQGPASSVVHGMPGAALASGAARFSLEIEEVPGVLLALAGAGRAGSC
jgi:two-component system, chemotaxis family, protein-glutamate methylesterase/glutaminase